MNLADRLAQAHEDGDEYDLEDIGGIVLVSYWWNNDSGMPNWSGGEDLVAFRDGSAAVVHTGDSEGGVELIELPTDGEARAAAIAGWIDANECAGFAALALEPLDSDRTLTDIEASAWREAIMASQSYLRVTVGEGEPAVRRVLAEVSIYARVRDALANPRSDHGQLLLKAIQAAAGGGAPSYLESGDWQEL